MWPDSESAIDYLNFSEIAESIADITSNPTLLPVSIGVFGDWGAGKSTILQLTQSCLSERSSQYIHIKFDAWLYQGYDDARASILETIANNLITQVNKNEGLLKKAEALASRVDKIRALGALADIGAASFGIPTGGAFGKFFGFARDTFSDAELDDSEIAEGVNEVKQVSKETRKLVRPAEKKSPPQQIEEFRKEYSELLKQINRPIIVYVDNLDRCTPINAINTLEAIRLFLFLPNTAFIIAADEDMIRSAVQEYHKGATQRHQTDYLDKLIQVPVKVPKPGVLEIRAYLFMLLSEGVGITPASIDMLQKAIEQSLQNSWRDTPVKVDELIELLVEEDKSLSDKLKEQLSAAERMAPILASSSTINGNPRIVKRLLNVVKMRKSVSDRRGMHLDESLITKLVIFERCAGKAATTELYSLIDKAYGKPEIFSVIENDNGKGTESLPEAWKNIQDFVLEWAKLPPTLDGKDLRAAAYLSRETIPMGAINTTLSPAAVDLVEILLATKLLTSPTAKSAVERTPSEDYFSVMEEVIARLRHESDWTTAPLGFGGAHLLAKTDEKCKQELLTFIKSLPKQKWMSRIEKELR